MTIEQLDTMSDLHLEFADLELPGGDVLILAGDTWVVRYMADPERVPDRYQRYVRFCKEELSKYRKVFLILGNHEHYGLFLHEARMWLPKFLAEHAPNATLLDNDTCVLDGVAFIGSTLWTSCGSETDAIIIRNRMNDYPMIHVMDDRGQPRNLAIEDVRKMHRAARRYIYAATLKHQDLPCVIITHHAPCLLSGRGDRRFGGELDAAYYSNLLHGLLPKRPNVMLCCHGHTHVPARYRLGNAEIISNPRGYGGRERCADEFDPTAGQPSVKFWGVG
jgi:Calcineurin-like phosphoesterase